MLNDYLSGYKIILASQSPRRKMLLAGLDLDFEVIVRPDVDESYPPEFDKIQIPEYLAEHKSAAYIDLLKDNVLLITADTVVWHNNRILGKPADYKDAFRILSVLSGSMHEVVTGVCLRTNTKKRVFSTLSKVWFRKLRKEEINYYLDNYYPYDKAGSYGIQEWIGYAGIDKIEGSFYNVMGLPVQTLYQELMRFLPKIR